MTVQFPPLTPEQAIKEANTLRRIATGLGSKESWKGAEELEWIALAITRSAGLPDPGSDYTLDFYRDAEDFDLPAPAQPELADDGYEWGIRALGVSGQVVVRPNKAAAEEIYGHYIEAPRLYGKVELCRRAKPHTWQVVKASQQ